MLVWMRRPRWQAARYQDIAAADAKDDAPQAGGAESSSAQR